MMHAIPFEGYTFWDYKQLPFNLFSDHFFYLIHPTLLGNVKCVSSNYSGDRDFPVSSVLLSLFAVNLDANISLYLDVCFMCLFLFG